MPNDPYVVLAAVAAVSLAAGFLAGFLVGRPSAPSQPGHKKTRSPGETDKGGSCELYVGNLSYDMSEKDLRRSFEAFGKVRGIRVIKNRFNGKPKGFAFIEMAGQSGGAAAIKGMNGKQLMGRKIIVNEAKSRERD